MNLRESVLHPAILVGAVVNTGLFLVGAYRLAQGDAAFFEYTREDGLVEWLQFVSFAVLAGLLGFLAIDRAVRHAAVRFDVLVLAGLTGLVALAALEEISWFQRVLGVTTPEFFLRHNRQDETNLHNLAIGDFNLHKEVLVRIIFITGIMHNLILPLLAIRRPQVRRWVESLGLYLPPLSASAVYLVLLALSQLMLEHPRRGEMGEAFGAVHYLCTVFAAYVVGVGYANPVFTDRYVRLRASMLFALLVVFLVFVSWLLGVGYSDGPGRVDPPGR
jgi:hypothetical protein